MGWDGLDGIGLDGLSYTAVTPRASLQSDADNDSVGEPDWMIASTNGSAPALLFLFFRKVNCCLFSPFPVVPGLVLVKNLKTLKSGIHGKTFAIDWIHIQAVLKLVEQNKIFRQLHHQHDSINPVQPVHQIHTIDVNLLIKSNLFSSFKPKFTQFVQYTLLIHSTQLRYLSLSGSWQFMQNRSLDPAKQHLGGRLLKSTQFWLDSSLSLDKKWKKKIVDPWSGVNQCELKLLN